MIRIGTRASRLALAQARIVATALAEETEVVVIRTAGDGDARPIRELGDGVFVTAIEDALRRRVVDVAVHSLKDLPTDEAGDLMVGAVPAREDPRDVLITAARGGLATLPANALIGTSSPRRGAFLSAVRPDLRLAEIRGNVDTRLRKVSSGEFDGTILALAGLRRLGIAVFEPEILTTEVMLPAPGQGALAIQCRAADVPLRERLAPLEDPATRAAVEAERALLHALGASCALALGALAVRDGDELVLEAALAADGGTTRARVRGRDPREVAMGAASQLRPVAHAV